MEESKNLTLPSSLTLQFQSEEECDAASEAYYSDTNKTLSNQELGRQLHGYKSKITKFDEDLDLYRSELYKMESEVLENVALFHVYFKELGMVQYLRDELYSVIDFIGMI